MRTPLAWKNVTHNKLRAFASLGGICFAIILVYMQLGFYDACFRSSSMIYDQLEFDAALVSPQYVHLRFAGTIPNNRLKQALRVPAVRRAMPLHVGNSTYRNREALSEHEIVVLAVDPENHPFRIPELVQNAHALTRLDSAIMDAATGKGYGPVEPDTTAQIGRTEIDVVATYRHGTGFVADASVFMGETTFRRRFPVYRSSQVSMGLIQFRAGTDIEQAITELQEEMPIDVAVLSRGEIEKNDQGFFVNVKPIGIMFSSGVILALCVGSVILYQILASEIMNQLKQYATLKAIGYGDLFLNKVVLQQATIFAVAGFLPGTIASYFLYEVTRVSTNLPMVLPTGRIVLVLVLSITMCSVSGLLVCRKVTRADPVDLF